jgi:hypothetical protein
MRSDLCAQGRALVSTGAAMDGSDGAAPCPRPGLKSGRQRRAEGQQLWFRLQFGAATLPPTRQDGDEGARVSTLPAPPNAALAGAADTGSAAALASCHAGERHTHNRSGNESEDHIAQPSNLNSGQRPREHLCDRVRTGEAQGRSEHQRYAAERHVTRYADGAGKLFGRRGLQRAGPG